MDILKMQVEVKPSIEAAFTILTLKWTWYFMYIFDMCFKVTCTTKALFTNFTFEWAHFQAAST